MEFITIKETADAIKNKKISINELNEVFIKRINQKLNLNAYIYFDEENIHSQLSSHIHKDTLLNGIPIAIKDLFCTKSMPTTAASKI